MDGIAPTPRRLFEEPFDGVKNNQETEEKLRKPSTHSYEVETKMVERKTVPQLYSFHRFLLLANEIARTIKFPYGALRETLSYETVRAVYTGKNK